MHRTILILTVVLGVFALGGCNTSHMAKGDRCFREGEYVSAIWEYGRVIEKEESADAALHRSAALKAMGNDTAAEADLLRAARWGNIEAEAVLASRRGIEDTEALEHLVEQHPGCAWTWALYGDAKLHSGDPEAAAEAYRRATEALPTGDLALTIAYNATLADLQRGNYEDAVFSFGRYRTLADDPLPPEGRYLGGLVAYARGDMTEAARYWKNLPPALETRVRQAVGDEPAFAAVD